MIGQTIAHYRITAKLGAGGMGEVYRATDGKLGREVALKVLPQAFAQDAQRMARFQREAQVLASLNHPNIATLHGLEEAFATLALAMELVEGRTLAERIAQGAIPLEEALPLAGQIAEALEYAHEKGVIHRDLKPANIKLTAEGKVKVLDFGLAKALAPESGLQDASNSPTISVEATKAGIILGTAAYMSPEQARGRLVDKRADIWAFGVVLYEMLAGRQAYGGETASDSMAAVITREPDWRALPATLPRRITALLRRCLAKNPSVRLRDIGEARISLEEIQANPGGDQEAAGAVSAGARVSRSWVTVAAAIGGLVLGATAWGLLSGTSIKTESRSAGASRFSITLPPEAPFYVEYYPGLSLAISRDGSRFVYTSQGRARKLYVRRFDDLEVRAVPGTEGATAPFFSPDGEWVAFFTVDGALKKVSLAGGNPVTLIRGQPSFFYVLGAWTDDGHIVFDVWNRGLRILSANGGEVTDLTAPQDRWHQDPLALPGSDLVLFSSIGAGGQRLETVSLRGGTPKVVLENASHGRYLSSGHLLFVREGSLMLAPFDVKRAVVTGPAEPFSWNVMFDDMRVQAPVPQLAVSLNGTMVYAPGSSTVGQSSFAWVDRNGQGEDLASLPLTLPMFRLSPDGERLAVASRVGQAARIQTFDLKTKTLTRIADEPQDMPMTPTWSPDGRRIFFTTYGTHEGAILAQDLESNLPPQPIAKVRGTFLGCQSVSSDGRYLTYSFIDTPEAGSDIWYLDLRAPAEAKDAAKPFLATSANEDWAAFSPDGRWVAYGSDESGTFEIYVKRFPGGESKQRVSAEGGANPLWSADGRELFFQARPGSLQRAKIMVAPVQYEPTFRVGAPRLLLEEKLAWGSFGGAYAVSRDARRLLVLRAKENPFQSPELIVVQNWFAELAEKRK